MKKELVCAGILLTLIVLSIVNIFYVGSRVDELTADVVKIQQLGDAGRTQEALKLLYSSKESWQSFNSYAGVMLRHSDEMSDVTESYYDITETLQAGCEVPPAMYEKLKHRLTNVAETESLQLSSLF